jgi:hypothetical protein
MTISQDQSQGSIGPIRSRQKKQQVKPYNKRGASSLAKHTASSLAEKQNLCQVGRNIIITFSALAEETLTIANGSVVEARNPTSVQDLMHRLIHAPMPETSITWKTNADGSWKTLGMLVQGCHEADILDSYAELLYWINVMQFASLTLR